MKTLEFVFALLATVNARPAVAYMSEILDTVFVKNEHGDPVRINAADYNEKVHGKIIEPKGAEAAGIPVTASTIISSPDGMPPVPPSPMAINTQPSAPAEPGAQSTAAQLSSVERTAVLTPVEPVKPVPVQRNVAKIGSKYFVTDPAGNKVDAEAFKEAGYKSEGEAWAAIAEEQTALAAPAAPPATA